MNLSGVSESVNMSESQQTFSNSPGGVVSQDVRDIKAQWLSYGRD